MNAGEAQRVGAEGVTLYERLQTRLQQLLQTLPDKPEETAESALRCLWHLAAGVPLSPDAAMEEFLVPLDTEKQRALEHLVDQRVSGIPLAHLSGRQRFMGMEMLASSQALIPRRETELLARTAIGIIRDHILTTRDQATVIDVCTGCGNVALAMASSDARVRAYAADLSPEAVELAQRNVVHLGLVDRVETRVGDLLQPFDEPRFQHVADIVTCNPPYISSKKLEQMPSEIISFEPRLAFDGGALGVKILQRTIREAPQFLRAGGWLLFEVGLGQGPAVMQRLASTAGYSEIRGVTDSESQIRVVVARFG
jgi:release factor glutamine methyltransferase